MFNLTGKQNNWTTTPVPKPENAIVDLDVDQDYEFCDTNKAYANAIYARINGGRSLYPDFPVKDLSDTGNAGGSRNEVVILDDENDPDMKAAIAASLADYKRHAEISLAELECSQRKNSRMESQMIDSGSEDEMATSQMLDEEVFSLRELLHGASCSPDQLSPHLALFENLSLLAAERLCEDLDLRGLTLEQAMTFTRAFVDDVIGDVTHASCCCVLKHVWLDKLKELSKNSSRSLISCLGEIIKKYPAATMETVLLPVWTTTQFKNVHGDLLNKLIKSCGADDRANLARELFRAKLEVMSESHITVLQTIFTAKVEFSPQSLEWLMTSLVAASDPLSGNNKFSKLLLTIMESQDAKVLAACKQSLTRCVAAQNTMLKASLEKALLKV